MHISVLMYLYTCNNNELKRGLMNLKNSKEGYMGGYEG